MKRMFGIALFFLSQSLQGETVCEQLLQEPKPVPRFGEARVKALKSWSRVLTWTLSPTIKPFSQTKPVEQKTYHAEGSALPLFKQNYGYFSPYRPIVSNLTPLYRDVLVTKCLLGFLSEEIPDRQQLFFTSHEILAKVMAYRQLKVGEGFSLPHVDGDGKVVMTPYIIDKIIDIWHGMPAFGLIPKGEGAPVLLFRGTDMTLTSEKGWASFLSDLDPKGPGLTTFLKGHTRIRKWLEDRKREENPARVVGFSLGGAFALYTLTYDYDLVLSDPNNPSIIFNAPGVPDKVYTRWHKIPEARRPAHTTYVNEGDAVSQIGLFLDNVWVISLPEPMEIIQAHLSLISAEPTYTLTQVDLPQENANR